MKGVEGNLYQILPFEVVTDKGGKRSDFGIHKDANASGSLGCIVMSGDRLSQCVLDFNPLIELNK